MDGRGDPVSLRERHRLSRIIVCGTPVMIRRGSWYHDREGEDPPSRTRHLIGNLEARHWKTARSEARTALLVYRSHLKTDHQLLSGCREDMLRKVNGPWKVRRRTIVLDANVLLDKNLSAFL